MKPSIEPVGFGDTITVVCGEKRRTYKASELGRYVRCWISADGEPELRTVDDPTGALEIVRREKGGKGWSS